MPEGDTLFRTAAGLRPYLVGPDRDGGPRQRTRARARRSSGSSASEITAVESVGKNLLIRFDDGLELRTHLRMNGSWHRYRPGERWRRPPARARLVLEVPGAVAVCFDAPVVELLETARGGAPPGAGRPRARICCRPTSIGRRGDPTTARPEPGRTHDRGGADRPAGAGRHRQRLQERDPVHRTGVAVRRGRVAG